MVTDQDNPSYREWAHAPAHLFLPNTAYIVTAATYHKVMLFDTAEKRDFLLQSLFAEAERWEWRLQAWAVMANHGQPLSFCGPGPCRGGDAQAADHIAALENRDLAQQER